MLRSLFAAVWHQPAGLYGRTSWPVVAASAITPVRSVPLASDWSLTVFAPPDAQSTSATTRMDTPAPAAATRVLFPKVEPLTLAYWTSDWIATLDVWRAPADPQLLAAGVEGAGRDRAVADREVARGHRRGIAGRPLD